MANLGSSYRSRPERISGEQAAIATLLWRHNRRNDPPPPNNSGALPHLACFADIGFRLSRVSAGCASCRGNRRL